MQTALGKASEAWSSLGRRRPGALGRAIRAWRRDRSRDGAVRRSLRTFERHHPGWAAALFDAALLGRPDALAALDERDAAALARAWTRQFRYRDERRRERDVRAVTPVAASFLALLAHELARSGGEPATYAEQ